MTDQEAIQLIVLIIQSATLCGVFLGLFLAFFKGRH